ncbi:MAG: flavodoxin family protein [Actinobacteria bacterium]|nr:flavodoxin family protein [Actinomycetota bacterium]
MADSGFRVLGLSTSPRKGGNTDLMLDSALEGAREAGANVEKIHTPGLDINPCRACNACFKTGQCVQQDDMQKLYPKLLSYDGIILAAPIFSRGLAAQAKIMIDRLNCVWARKSILHEQAVSEDIREKRRGLWLSAAGSPRPDIFEPAVPTIRYFFAMLEIKDWDSITFSNVDEKGAIKGVDGALERCRGAGADLLAGS